MTYKNNLFFYKDRDRTQKAIPHTDLVFEILKTEQQYEYQWNRDTRKFEKKGSNKSKVLKFRNYQHETSLYMKEDVHFELYWGRAPYEKNGFIGLERPHSLIKESYVPNSSPFYQIITETIVKQ